MQLVLAAAEARGAIGTLQTLILTACAMFRALDVTSLLVQMMPCSRRHDAAAGPICGMCHCASVCARLCASSGRCSSSHVCMVVAAHRIPCCMIVHTVASDRAVLECACNKPYCMCV